MEELKLYTFSDWIEIKNNIKNPYKLLNILKEQYNNRPIRNLTIEVYGECNLRCIMCNIRNVPKEKLRHIPYKQIEPILEELCPYTDKVTLYGVYGLGEPLHHPDFKKIVKKIREHGAKIEFTSNGTLLDDDELCEFVAENVELISISIDAATKNTYEKIRIGSDWDKLIRGIKKLNKKKEELNKQTPVLMTKFTIMQLNYKEIKEFNKLLNDLGISFLSFSHVICYKEEDLDKLAIYNDKKMITEFTNIVTEIFPNKLSNYLEIKKPSNKYIVCPFSYYNSIYIKHDGGVHLCSATAYSGQTKIFKDEDPYKSEEVKFGNIYEEDIVKIWEKDEYKKYRYGILLNQPYGYCNKCITARGMFI